MWGIGDNKGDVALNYHVANQLGVCYGDKITFEISQLNETFLKRIAVVDKLRCDFIVNGALHLEMIESIMINAKGIDILSNLDIEICKIPEQYIFKGLKIIRRGGKCVLFFDGGCNNNLHEPNGWGFYINPVDHPEEHSEMFMSGYGYDSNQSSSNYMEYLGLIEGLRWAVRHYPK